MFVRSEKGAWRINGARITKGEYLEVPDSLLPTLKELIGEGEITVHDSNPNAPKPTPKKPRKKATKKRPAKPAEVTKDE
jgi:hypothetical protein